MPITILVVDDEPDLEALIRQRYRKQIRSGEYEMLFAANGVHALSVFESTPGIEILLTDINMPEMDGLTLLDKVKSLSPPLKSVVISAYGDMTNIRTAMNLGAFDFLTKPIDLDDLDLTIARTHKEVEALKRISEDRNRLLNFEKELSVASRIQQSMLPHAFPERDEFDLYATMLAAKGVGGDFYDFFLLGETRLGVVLGDVSGKGIPAALLMAMSRTLMKSSARTGRAPGEAMAMVNSLLCEDKKGNEFVTLFYGILDFESGHFEYCNAGHCPPYHLRSGSPPKEIPLVGGMIIGVKPEAPYETGAIEFSHGDSLVLFSDGVTEAMDSSKNQYGEERLAAILSQPAACPEQRVELLLTDVREHCQESEQSDDITVLILQYGK